MAPLGAGIERLQKQIYPQKRETNLSTVLFSVHFENVGIYTDICLYVRHYVLSGLHHIRARSMTEDKESKCYLQSGNLYTLSYKLLGFKEMRNISVTVL